MKKNKSPYICPLSKEDLYYVKSENLDINLLSKSGMSYEIIDGIPKILSPNKLDHIDLASQEFYDGRADQYDENLHLTFKTHNVDENIVRNDFIDLLEIEDGHKVLDLACGTGRDSKIIAERLGKNGELFCMDISKDMLRRCKKRLELYDLKKEICIANALHLPYPDDFFDSTYSFGAIGEFSNLKASLKEMTRVTRKGGKIVFGDESIPIWLRNTKFSKILITTNPQFEAPLPLESIPIDARDIAIRFVIGGVFYLIDYRVGDGEPKANFDFEIPGVRGGTYRTRYEGRLEGVTSETKKMVQKVISQKGISMHEWLEDVVSKAAANDFDKKDDD